MRPHNTGASSLPLLRYCARCERPHLELTHCHSVDKYLCEECIIALAQRFFDRHFRPSPPLVPEDPDAPST